MELFCTINACTDDFSQAKFCSCLHIFPVNRHAVLAR